MTFLPQLSSLELSSRPATGPIATRAPFWTVALSCTPAQTGASSLEALVTHALVTTAPSHKHLVLICRAVARCQVTTFIVASLRHRPRSTCACGRDLSSSLQIQPQDRCLFCLHLERYLNLAMNELG